MGGGQGEFFGFGGFGQGFNMMSAEQVFKNFFGDRDPFADFFDEEEE